MVVVYNLEAVGYIGGPLVLVYRVGMEKMFLMIQNWLGDCFERYVYIG